VRPAGDWRTRLLGVQLGWWSLARLEEGLGSDHDTVGSPLLSAIDDAERTARRRAWAINRSRTHMQLTS
jgi:hypothetical protein